MIRLTGLDANFLYWETPSNPMHTLKVAVVDMPAAVAEQLPERFAAHLERRIAPLPGFRARVLHVPLRLHHPVWVDDPEFDIQQHVHHGVLPSPGTDREMDEAIAGIAAGVLPRDRALWAVWVLRGRTDGGVVFVFKVHHALADGEAAARLIEMALEPVGDERLLPAQALPRRRSLIRSALAAQPGRIAAFPSLVVDTIGAGARTLTEHRSQSEGFVRPFVDAPVTALNRSLPTTRAFATTSVPTAAVRAIKQRLGVTFNDVVLTVAGGATARFLSGFEPATESLTAAVPVACERGENHSGNNLSNLLLSLCTDEPDPERRAHRIAATTRAAKATHDALGAHRMGAWAEYTPARTVTGALRLYGKLRLADRHRPPVNLIVSNVRGPASVLQAGAARVRSLFSVGPILLGIGLNITVWSYGDTLGFTALSHGELPCDLHGLTDEIARLIQELAHPIPAACTA
jgi:diacylglycerol O-acyltransferase / wax synthase